MQLQITDNCWICEGFQEVEFYFNPGISTDLFTKEFFQEKPGT